MLAPSRFLVNAFVQLGRDREGKRQEECGEQPACNGDAAKPGTLTILSAAHVSGLWFVRANSQGKSFALTNDIQLRTVGLMLRCARLSLADDSPIMTTAARISYAVLALTLVLAGVLHLGAALLALLFSYFALRKLFSFTKTKWLALILFVLLAASIACRRPFYPRCGHGFARSRRPFHSFSQRLGRGAPNQLPFTDF